MKDRLNLVKYKETRIDPLQQATLCFLVRDNQVLLAMKKRGFGEGKWNGAGGKMDNGDTNIEETAKREVLEEIGVIPRKMKRMAVLGFYFPDKEEWGQQVSVYVSTEWDGEPTETDEMKPKWFDLVEIPFDQMWEDEKYWLPQVLDGVEIEADFLFSSSGRMLEKNVREKATNTGK